MIPPSGTRFQSTDESTEPSWVGACLEGIDLVCGPVVTTSPATVLPEKSLAVPAGIAVSTGMGPNIETAANFRGSAAIGLVDDGVAIGSRFIGDAAGSADDGAAGGCRGGGCVVAACVVAACEGDGRDANRGDGNGLLHGEAGPAPRSRADWPNDSPAVDPRIDAANAARIATRLGSPPPAVLEHALRCNRIDNSENGDARWRYSTLESAPVQMEQSELSSHAIQSSCPLVNGERTIRWHNTNLEKSQRSLTLA
ncbi:MAG: hypothetical protein FJ308_01660 [Planctomycetes bacterium]|nr:hypothetical protein [Planctomycetota bacterium]